MPIGVNYESAHTQISYIFYFFKISKLPTLRGRCGLEGIVIKLLPGINQPHASSKTLPDNSLITIPSNPHRPFKVGSLLILKKYKM